MTPQAVLADLVAIGDLPGASNARMAGYVQAYLARLGVDCAVLPGPEGDRVNLFATIGPRDVPGYILSGHMDVVPVEGQNWASDPFRLRAEGGRLYGRGASDMKGYLACMLAMVPAFQAAALRRPIHLAFSYDEEIGCRGVGHMIARLRDLCAPPLGCIVGEPSDLQPVLSHKGKQAVELRIKGRAAHSSQPDLGVNAIYPAAEILLFIRNLAAKLAVDGPFDPRFQPACSTLVAGVVQGGAAVNIIPDQCTIRMEVRSVPGQSPQTITAQVIARLAALPDVEVSHRELSSYPALPPPETRDLVDLLERLTGHRALQSVSYGTEAGLFHAAGIPSIICGPGSILRAHRPDEFITEAELESCCAMLHGLAREAAS
ncbi:acetylornithine deacetylase [Pseudotabrizicola alkalilacus]|uniref:Acetylornithine deacetylase n=1 Tax=Pseudotabrizicola alkalilacus TaxID=2305252 RepID=A0A411YYR7_9RHOB|nr:acetylornithine deacetylase [Pseudotabrizicola alkalilacus]RGP35938.1 acetylornithine deacetylase [Pseudotabrizicola alkalilacus]